MSLVWDIICQTFAVLHLAGAVLIAVAFVVSAITAGR